LIKDTSLKTEKGIVVDEFLQTNIPDVYAIGDCAQMSNAPENRRSIEAVWYVGRMMGETVAQSITGEKTLYDPGHWFNSAKFFDIEYQTYGQVNAQRKDAEYHFFWESKNGKCCINIAYKENNLEVMGINTLGIRMRHEVWDRWLREQKKLDYVVSNLSEANFDSELYQQFDAEIQQAYNDEFRENPIAVRKRGILERLLT
jgi:NADH dehydrogenase FAD-containing subunit